MDIENKFYGYKNEDSLNQEVKKLLNKMRDYEKPDVVVFSDYDKGFFNNKENPFKEFYKLTELSRYFMYEPHVGAGKKQLNGVFCNLEKQLIKTLNNTLNTLGKMEKNKRLKDIYENARGKK